MENALRLKAVIETAIDGILTIDSHGRIESMNQAAAQLFGYTVDEVLGRNVSMLMPEPYHGEHDEYIARYQRTHVPHIIGIGREVRGKRKDGTIFPMRLAVGETRIGDRTIYTGIIHDLSDVKAAEQRYQELNQVLEQKVADRTDELAATINMLLTSNNQLEYEIKERKAAEKKLRETLEKEKKLNELKSRFVTTASHEFRTPLSSILSSAELLGEYKTEAQQPKREKHINRIKSSVKTMTDILNDFLSLSRLEEGRIRAQPSTFRLCDFCDDMINEISPVLKPGQTITHTGQCELLIHTDRKLLKNICINLLSNASKYSAADTPIVCTTKEAHEIFCISITDQGIGIPKEEQQYLFTRFFRAHNAENIQGTGLGLNIVRRYVTLLGGKISYQSAVGIGSTFTVEIPTHLLSS